MATRLKSKVYKLDNDFDTFFKMAYHNGWTDGLPVVPPTKERVMAMINYVGRDPEEIISEVPPRFGVATVEKIAINAVMAGCLPEYMPVLIAAIEAVSLPKFNLDHQQTTTASSYQMVIINGPIRKKLEVNSGRGCLGPGWRANATIGRAVRLCALNIGGGIPGEVSKSILQIPGRYTCCFGEDEENSHWEPLHIDRGFKKNTSTVTVFGCFCQYTVSTGPTQPSISCLLQELSDSMAYMGSYNMLLGGGPFMVILQSGHTKFFNEAGYSKQAVKQYLFEHARVPFSRFPADRFVPGQNPQPLVVDGMTWPTRKPEDIMIVIAGGQEPYIPQIAPAHIGSEPQTVAIKE